MQSVAGPALKTASLNLAMNSEPDVIVREIKSSAPLNNADVLFLQEVVRGSDTEPSVAQALAGKLGRHVMFASPDGGSTRGGLKNFGTEPESH